MIIVNLLILYYSALFLTTAIDKMISFKDSVKDVENYNIIPVFLVRPFIYVLIFIHLLISANLLFSYSLKFTLSLSAITILLYTIAVIINLLRNNKIPCGCNGMIGNKIITWNTVLRNIILLLGIGTLYLYKPLEFQLVFLFYLLVYLEIYTLYKLYKEFPMINKKKVKEPQ